MGGNYTVSPGVSLGDPIHLVKHPSKCVHTLTHVCTHTQQLLKWAQNMDLFRRYEKLLEWWNSRRSWLIWSVLLCSFHRNINKHKERTISSKKLISCKMRRLHLWRKLTGQDSFLHSVLRGLLQDLVNRTQWNFSQTNQAVQYIKT